MERRSLATFILALTLMASPFSPENLAKAVANTAAQTTGSVQEKPDPPSAAGPIAALIGGNAADAASTWAALRSNPNVMEGNPLLPQNPAKIAAIKAAATLPEILLVKHLNEHGHPNIAKALGYGLGALGGGIAANNITHIK